MNDPQIIKSATMAENTHGDRVIKISFPYDLAMLENIRTLPGRKWHADLKVWSTPVDVYTLTKLQEWGFVLDERLHTFISKITTEKAELSISGISGLKGILRPFQNEGVAFIDSNKGNALVADEQGLGKTIETIAWLHLHPECRPAIVVCPSFLKLNWERECHAWLTNPKTVILKGTKPYSFKGDIIIINYDIIFDWYKELRKRNPQILIMDEVQYIKSDKAKRTKAVKMFAKSIPNKLGLSGTPIENRPIEISNAIFIIKPDLFPNPWHFKQRYCSPKHNGFGWDFNGASNIAELHRILIGTIMIRRKKEDVLKDLPDKVYSYIPMELSNEKEYFEAEADFISWLKKEKGVEAAKKASATVALSSIEALKQLAVKGKLKQSIEWIEDFLESGKKLVVFTTHHFVIDELINHFSKIAVRVDGRVNITDRQRSVDIFQHNPEIKLFIGNIEAAGVGITLTAACDVVFLELPWSPGKLVQASDRVHRIGQKNAVNIYFLLSSGTIEERIAKLLDAKLKVITAVLDGKEVEDSSLLMELMKEYS